MALTNNNTLDIAYKKLVGKTHTSSGFLSSQEENGTFAQLDVSKVFGQVIPSLASQAVSEGIAEEVTLYLKGDSRSQYDESGEGLGTHAFNLYTDVALTIPFQGNIIPDSFGTSYAPDLKTDTDEKVDKLSNHNWTFDASSAVVWFQNTSVAPVPSDGWKITVYKYIGKSLSDVVSEGSNGGSAVIEPVDPPQGGYIVPDLSNKVILLNAGGESIDIRLPDASLHEGKEVIFKRIDDTSSGNIVRIQGHQSETSFPPQFQIQLIDDYGGTSNTSGMWALSAKRYVEIHVQYETLSLYCDGTKWHII